MNPDVFLEQKDVSPLIAALTRWSQQVIIASDRQDVLNNSGIHQALLNQIKFDNKAPLFANNLVAELKKYSFSYQKADYHPLVNLLQHLCDRAQSEIDELPEEDIALFGKLLEEGKDKLNALASRHAVGRIESPKGTGIGTGVLIKPDLLLTCNHVFTKSQAKKAWVRFNCKSGTLPLDNYLFELDLSPDVAKSDRKPMVFKIEDYLREIGLQSKGERRSLYSIMQRPLPPIDDETEAELRSLETLFE